MIAFVFPGQGSQRVGMGTGFVTHQAWELARLAQEVTGTDVPGLLLEADRSSLQRTQHAQLVVLVHALMCLRAARDAGLEPNAAIGHSVGEIAALVAAGVLDEWAAIGLVAVRGEQMALACEREPGGMTAVRADRAVAAELVASHQNTWIAAYNSPRQVVVGGRLAPLSRLESAAEEVGLRVHRLPVAGAFHTPLMQRAKAPFLGAMADVRLTPPGIPIAANVSGWLEDAPDPWPSLLVDQLTRPVQWEACTRRLAEFGCRTFVELGGSGVLSGAIRAVVPGAECLAIRGPADIARIVERSPEDDPAVVIAE